MGATAYMMSGHARRYEGVYVMKTTFVNASKGNANEWDKPIDAIWDKPIDAIWDKPIDAIWDKPIDAIWCPPPM
jgi:hypothetical protein